MQVMEIREASTYVHDTRYVNDTDGQLWAIVAICDDMSAHDNPLDWDAGNSIFYVIDWGRGIAGDYYNRSLRTESELDNAWIEGHLSDGEREDALIKHYTRNGFTAERVTLRGYSQGDWLSGVYAYKDYSVLDTLQSYFAGDVYMVGRVKVDSEDDAVFLGDLEEWIGGIYESPEWSAIDVYLGDSGPDIQG